MIESRPRARVGTSGWKKRPWRGNFYPPTLPQRRELEYAAGRLASLEVNTTFYGPASPSSYQNWRAEAPEDFVFSVKADKAVTHDHRLENPASNVADFLASGPLGLREKAGPVLWQVPPSLPFRRPLVERFLAVLPHSVPEARHLIERYGSGGPDHALVDLQDRPIRHAFEVRHSSFLNPDFAKLLREYDVAAAVTNSPGLPAIEPVTSDFVYARLHGDLNHYPNGYDDDALDAWAALVNGWTRGESCPDGRGRDVFVYFDNPDNRGIRSPFDAMRLQERLDDRRTARWIGADRSVQPPLWEE